MPVQKQELEGGIMASAGKRVEIKSSSICNYRSSKRQNSKNDGCTSNYVSQAALDFHHILKKSSLRSYVSDDINRLKKNW
jgi:hypothetical protein